MNLGWRRLWVVPGCTWLLLEEEAVGGYTIVYSCIIWPVWVVQHKSTYPLWHGQFRAYCVPEAGLSAQMVIHTGTEHMRAQGILLSGCTLSVDCLIVAVGYEIV